MAVVDAVERDLVRLKRRDAALAESALAESALVLARELDSAQNSATSKSMCARALREVLDRLNELAPVEEETDSVDELEARRATRLGGSAA
jgi:hypothetical protein